MEDFRQKEGKRFGGGRRSGFGGRDGGRSNFSRKSWGGSRGRDRGPVVMHQAVCDQCGNPCEVPFRPTEGKPVYCNVCFGDKKKTGNDRGSDRFSRENFDSHKNFSRTDLSNNVGKGDNDWIKRQLEVLNAKIDCLINAVEGAKNTKSVVAEEETAKKKAKTVPVIKVKKSTKKSSKKTKK